ncbi:MAG TPA: thioesterase family protein [Burkholderiales bacterium]|jgi:acyl-CoA thioester hydrolase|nr:thioesterase family protein [Burkholderiales bacterium]
MTQHRRKLVHTETIPIRWGDMDAMGHVNNTVYFRYMEQARVSWFDALGVRPNPRGVGPVIINSSCTFMKQLIYPGEVEVRTYAGKVGNSSFETWLEMRPSYDPETVYAEGAAKVVWVDFDKGKSIPLPEKIRQIVGG